jgi:hypothetical protein
MIDVEERVRHEAFVAAAVTGAGIAVIGMRFLFPSMARMLYLVAGLVMSLGGGGLHVAIKRKPPAWQLFGVGAAAFAMAAGIIWVIAPSAANVRLLATKVPDLEISLPRDGVDQDLGVSGIYNDAGHLESAVPDGLELASWIVWRKGPMPAADDAATIKSILGATEAHAIADPGLFYVEEHHTYAVTSQDGHDGFATTFECNSHFYIAVTVGTDALTLHRRVVDSAQCGRGR